MTNPEILGGLPYVEATHLNHEGFSAFRRSLAEQTLQVLLTGTLCDTFYVGRDSISREAVQTLTASCGDDPELFARMIVYAREAGCMRLLPTLATVILSGSPRKDLFESVFPRVVTTPRELRDFLLLCRRSSLRKGLGRGVKRAVGAFLTSLSEYHLIKYGRDHGPFSLRDAARLCRPRPADARQSLLLEMIVRGMRRTPADAISQEFPQVKAWRDFLDTSDREDRLRLIEQGRLPYEAVLGAMQPDTETWAVLVRQMPLLALLRHVCTLFRSGAVLRRDTLEYVCGRLSDRAAVRAARILPFRFFSAWHALQELRMTESFRRFFTLLLHEGRLSAEPRDDFESFVLAFRELSRALASALDASLSSVSLPEGRVCIGLDVSGSMSSPAAAGSNVRLVDIGALFAAALLRQDPDRATVLPFDTRVHDFVPSGDDVFHLTRTLGGLGGGGTALSAPVSHLLSSKAKVDHFIGITDNEEWAEDPSGNCGFLGTWRRYRHDVSRGARAWLLTLAPYRDAVAPQGEEGVHFFYGWSDEVAAHLALRAACGDQLEAVGAWLVDPGDRAEGGR